MITDFIAFENLYYPTNLRPCTDITVYLLFILPQYSILYSIHFCVFTLEIKSLSDDAKNKNINKKYTRIMIV